MIQYIKITYVVTLLLIFPLHRVGLRTTDSIGASGSSFAVYHESHSSSFRPSTLTGNLPIIIGHRGSSGTHPEESLAAYEKAAEVGADYLECDVQVTKDSVLVCSHEPNLSFLITDIEEDKHRTKFPLSGIKEEIIDETAGAPPTKQRGWFIADYTWEDIQTVHLVQSYMERDRQYNGQFPSITVDQLLDLAIKHGKGVYLEAKDSTWYQNTRNINLPKLLIKLLCRRGFCRFVNDGPNVEPNTDGHVPTQVPMPIPFLGSLCYDDLVYWSDIGVTKIIPTTALVYTIVDDKPVGFGQILHRIKSNPDGETTVKLDARSISLEDLKRLRITFIGPDKNLILNNTEYIKEAHASGFGVHAWTFRNEPAAMTLQNKEGSCKKEDVEYFIDPKFDGDVYKEMKFFYDLGLDGFISDYPGTLYNFLDIQDLLCSQKLLADETTPEETTMMTEETLIKSHSVLM